MKQKKVRMNQQGMSLIEILIVITLIAVAGSFVMNQVFDRLQEGYVQGAKNQIQVLKGLLEDYRRYCNQYPTSEQGLDALLAKPSSGPDCPNYPASGFLKDGRVPLDPWTKPYAYESDGRTFVITSFGRDGVESGESFDKDIKSNEI